MTHLAMSPSKYLVITTKPPRRDRIRRGGGIITYVREDIPSKILDLVDIPNDIEGTFIEINLRKVKWIIFSRYFPPW